MIKLPKQTEAVLFDMDGTLVDSMGMWKQIDIDFLGRYGISMPEDLQECIEGLSFRETAQYFLDHFSLPLTIDELMDIWNDMALDSYRYHVPLKEGALEFLETLKKLEIPMGIVTSNSTELMEACLEALDIKRFFGVFVDGKQIKCGKPAPDGYLLAAKTLGADPSNCLVCEDVPQGIRAGKAAGMTVWAIADDYSEFMRETKTELADAMLESYFDVLWEE